MAVALLNPTGARGSANWIDRGSIRNSLFWCMVAGFYFTVVTLYWDGIGGCG